MNIVIGKDDDAFNGLGIGKVLSLAAHEHEEEDGKKETTDSFHIRVNYAIRQKQVQRYEFSLTQRNIGSSIFLLDLDGASVYYLCPSLPKSSCMKKYILSFIVVCLSLASSLMTFQAAAQDHLTEDQVRGIVSSAVKKTDQTCLASSLYGPRFEVIPVPATPSRFFKFDKETGDTWAISTYKSTTSKKLGRQPGGMEDARPGEINYQLLVNSWNHIVLLNVNTGTMWESRFKTGKNASFEDFKEVDAEH